MRQIVSDRPSVDRVRFWAGPRMDGAEPGADGTYRPIQLDGLPDTVSPIRRTPDGWYYTHGYGGDGGLYGSVDGLHWTPIGQR
jgi:hypothetical protein